MMPPSLNITVPINPGSDGDPSRWPGPDCTIKGIRALDDTKYRTTLGNKWMENKGESITGHSYILNRFPSGYKLFGRTRENTSHTDTYLFGHPSGYSYKSTNEFFDHFVNLMAAGGTPKRCQCKGCIYKGYNRASTGGQAAAITGAPSGSTSGATASRRNSRKSETSASSDNGAPSRRILPPPPTFYPAVDDRSEMVDEEGTPDIYRSLAQDLKDQGSLDVAIEEPESIDWCIETNTLPDHIRKLQRRPRFMPRSGELVLFFRNPKAGQSLLFNEKSATFKLWDEASECWIESPRWEAGVITETPDEDVSINDVLLELGKTQHINYSGFRVEPMPNIGVDRKPWSKRSTYVPLHQIRPLCFWREYLRGIERQDYHPTIFHALTAASSFSTLQKFHFKGTFPDATIFCKGVFIGPELILVGDAVRLAPQKKEVITDILIITAIKLKVLNIGDSESRFGEDDTRPPPWYTCLHVSGIGFTTDTSRAYDGHGEIPIDAKTCAQLPRYVDGYGSWYRMHGPDQRLEMPFQQVLGRCFEDEAMMLWFPSKLNSRQQSPVSSFKAINTGKGKATAAAETEADLSIGLQGTLEARVLASQRDPRIGRNEGKTWFWANDRVEQLDLQEVKNVDVGVHSTYGGEVSTSPRQARHLDAMKRAKKARERGYKGPGGRALSGREYAGGVSSDGAGQKFQPSGLVAGGLNAVQLDEDEQSSDSDSDIEMIDGNGGRLSRHNGGLSAGEAQVVHDEDDHMAADQLGGNMAGGYTKSLPRRQSTVIVLD